MSNKLRLYAIMSYLLAIKSIIIYSDENFFQILWSKGKNKRSNFLT